MIPNQWYPIFDSGRLRRGRPTGVTRLGRELVLWRHRQRVTRSACWHDGVMA